jgi:hypothetical protein
MEYMDGCEWTTKNTHHQSFMLWSASQRGYRGILPCLLQYENSQVLMRLPKMGGFDQGLRADIWSLFWRYI